MNNYVPKLFMFIFSPFLSLPITLHEVYKKKPLGLWLYSITCGVSSALYIPSISNDKVKYIELYNDFSLYGFDFFANYLQSGRPDFILHALIYLFAAIQIPVPFLFLLIIAFTVGIYFYVFFKLFSEKLYSNQTYFFCFVLILFSFSLPDLFSGIRFYFASAFLLLAFYNGILERNIGKGIVFLLLSIFTHFSMALFVPVYLLLVCIPDNYKLYRILFIVSFVFVFIPKSLIISIVDFIGLSGGYGVKAEVYLSGDDFVEGGIKEGSANYVLVYLFSIGWSFFAYIYMFLTIKQRSLLRNILYCSFAFINVFYSLTTVYTRYLLIMKILFIFLLIYEFVKHNNKKPLIIMFSLTLIGFLSNLILLRYNIIESYFNSDVFTIINIFFREQISWNDFLR